MSSITETCKQFVPAPLKRRPRLAIVLATAGAIGAIGSGLAGFTDLLDYLLDREPITEERAYITHQQFNTLIIPLVNNVDEMQTTIAELRDQVQRLQNQTSRGSRSPAGVEPNSPAQPRGESVHPPSADLELPEDLKQTLDRVQKMQREQRAVK